MRNTNRIIMGYVTTSNESGLLSLSIRQMLSYDWVRHIVVLHTDQDGPTNEQHRVSNHYKNFGHGFDKSVAEGGFDEVSARNHLIKLMKWAAQDCDCEWLLICDSDEFYLPATGTLPAKLNRSGHRAAWLDCWHLISPYEHLHNERQDILIQGARMHDPHPRLVNREVPLTYVPNQDLLLVYPEAKNETLHCWPQFPGHLALPTPGQYHLHLKYLLGKADYREQLSATCQVARLGQPIRLPEQYQAAIWIPAA